MSAPSGRPDPALPSVLTEFGFTDRWAAVFVADHPGADPYRVIRDDRGAVVAVGDAGDVRFEIPRGIHPVTGDWIAVADNQIVGVAHRVSAVVRPRADGEPQVLAANVDVVGLVHGLDQPLNRRRLERGLVLAWESGAQPVVILTKADVADDAAGAARDAAATGAGVDVVVSSAVDGSGLDEIAHLLRPNRTMALLGASGAGKSSLVNALLGEEAMATQEVRAGDRRGRHTTTHRELLLVPGGGVLLDTPGLRALTVGAATEGVDKAFPEIEELAVGCRFDDCRHDREPGCAVLAAVESGVLSADRYEGWRRIQREVASAKLRADPVALHQQGRQWGRMTREALRLKGRDDNR